MCQPPQIDSISNPKHGGCLRRVWLFRSSLSRFQTTRNSPTESSRFHTSRAPYARRTARPRDLWDLSSFGTRQTHRKEPARPADGPNRRLPSSPSRVGQHSNDLLHSGSPPVGLLPPVLAPPRAPPTEGRMDRVVRATNATSSPPNWLP